MKTQLLIPAAGMGTRLGYGVPKALIPLGDRPLLVHTLERLAPLGLMNDAVITVPAGHRDAFEGVLSGHFPGVPFALPDGGAERQDSVRHGLDALRADTDIVVIHDAARPFVSLASVKASIEAAADCGAATVAVPSVDTILEGDENGYLVRTPERGRLWACQTPQTFRVEVIREAHDAARKHAFLGTDDASLVRRLGFPVKLVMGSPFNFKVTTPADLAIARHIAQEALADLG